MNAPGRGCGEPLPALSQGGVISALLVVQVFEQMEG